MNLVKPSSANGNNNPLLTYGHLPQTIQTITMAMAILVTYAATLSVSKDTGECIIMHPKNSTPEQALLLRDGATLYRQKLNGGKWIMDPDDHFITDGDDQAWRAARSRYAEDHTLLLTLIFAFLAPWTALLRKTQKAQEILIPTIAKAVAAWGHFGNDLTAQNSERLREQIPGYIAAEIRASSEEIKKFHIWQILWEITSLCVILTQISLLQISYGGQMYILAFLSFFARIARWTDIPLCRNWPADSLFPTIVDARFSIWDGKKTTYISGVCSLPHNAIVGSLFICVQYMTTAYLGSVIWAITKTICVQRCKKHIPARNRLINAIEANQGKRLTAHIKRELDQSADRVMTDHSELEKAIRRLFSGQGNQNNIIYASSSAMRTPSPDPLTSESSANTRANSESI